MNHMQRNVYVHIEKFAYEDIKMFLHIRKFEKLQSFILSEKNILSFTQILNLDYDV